MFIGGLNRNIDKFIEYLLYVFIAVFPFLTYQGFLFSGTATRGINLIIVVEVIALILGFYLLGKDRVVAFAKSPVTVVLGVFFGVMFLSSLLGVDFETSFWSKMSRTTGLFYFIHLFFFYFILFAFFESEKKMKRLLEIFLVSAAIFSVGSFFQGNGFTIGNSTFAGMYLYSAFILGIYYVNANSEKIKSWWIKLTPLVFIINPNFINLENFPSIAIGSAQASSYVAIISVLLLIGAWLVSKIKSSRVRSYVIWGLVFAGIVSLSLSTYSLLSKDGYVQKLYLTQSGTARPIVWEIAKKSIAERPILGWGNDNFVHAFESNYDNRLLELKNGGEGWFDRAHNIFLDQTVENGYVGLSAYIALYLVLFGCLIYVLFRSRNKNHRLLSIVLIVYFIGHILELQTAFDTTISYVPMFIMIALAASIFHKTLEVDRGIKMGLSLNLFGRYVVGVLMIGVFGYLFFVGTIPTINSQVANGSFRAVGNSEGRLRLYPAVFKAPTDISTFIWRASYDLQRGIAMTPSVINDPRKRTGFVKELEVFDYQYERYLSSHPNDYRSRIQSAATHIYERLFEVDHLERVHKILDEAIVITPFAPQAYWMKAVAYLYQGKFEQAKVFAKKGYDLNPDIEESTRLLNYINSSIKTFPEIDLYAFKHL